MLIRYYCLCIILMGVIAPLFAQEDKPILDRDKLNQFLIRELDQTATLEVFSASRSSKKVSDLPIRTHIVTREEILINGYTTLVDVLKSVPGIKVSQPGSSGFGEMFLMRGLIGNEYAKVLVNNIPIQPSLYGGINIGAQLPIRQAERIEIIFGPASSIYGADAMSGVINIITKVPDNTHYAQADMFLGDYGYTYQNFSAGGKVGKNKNILQYSIFGSRQARKSMNIRHESDVFNTFDYLEYYEPDPPSISSILNPETFVQNSYPTFYQGSLEEPEFADLPERSHHMGVQLNYQGWMFSYNHMYVNTPASVGRNPYLFSYANPNAFSGEYVNRASLKKDYELGKILATSHFSYLRQRTDINSSIQVNYFSGDDGTVYFYSASDDLFTEHIFRYYPREFIEIIAGASYQFSGNFPTTNDLSERFDPGQYSSFTRNLPDPDPLFGNFGFNPVRFSNTGVFGQVYLNLGQFSIIGGLRHDYHSEYGSSTNPRIGLTFKAEDNTSIRANFGTGFRSPTADVTYRSIAFPADMARDSIFYIYIPTRSLKPEKYRSFELGVRRNLIPKVFLEVNSFVGILDNSLTNLVVPLPRRLFPKRVSSNNTAQTIGNSRGAKTTLVSLQALIQARNLLPEYKLNIDLSATISRGSEKLPDNSALERSLGEIDDVRMTPRFMGNLNINFNPLPGWYIATEHVLMSEWTSRFTPTVDAYESEIGLVDGYYNLDFKTAIELGANLRIFAQVRNVLNKEYGGIGATGLDIDLFYNPQYKRTIQFGLSFNTY